VLQAKAAAAQAAAGGAAGQQGGAKWQSGASPLPRTIRTRLMARSAPK
jgi:hypothetical protein